jgi:hypothetical protein
MRWTAPAGTDGTVAREVGLADVEGVAPPAGAVAVGGAADLAVAGADAVSAAGLAGFGEVGAVLLEAGSARWHGRGP